MLIDGHTELIAHIGFPTHAFKAPLIYNPWFDHAGLNARVVPMGCRPADYPAFLRAVHAEQPDLPVIVTSATTSTTAAEDVMRWGAQCFLPKPLDLEGLAQELGRALARRADVPPANDVIPPTDDDAMEPEANA